MEQLAGRKALVIGLGISGRSAAAFLLSSKAQVVGVDRNQELLNTNAEIIKLRSQGLATFLDTACPPIQTFDLIVVSPGIPQTHPLYQSALRLGIEVLGEIELACRHLSQKCIGITGTNGKTTVTLLITHVLNESKIPAKALGNSGIPLSSILHESQSFNPKTVIVAELSSFQLETMHSRILDAAILLNITPDHLDRYQGMEEYAKAKMLITKCLKSKSTFYVEEKCYQEFGYLIPDIATLTYGYAPTSTLRTDSQQVFFKENIECYLPLQYRGVFSHDVENFLAAYGICREFGVAPEQFLQAFSTFKKPSHRVEFVRRVGEVDFVDDSKGTNIDAVMRAVGSMKGNVILIAGGVDKGAAYTPWLESFAGKVRCICAIGEAAPKIKQDLGREIDVGLFKSLEEAVLYAAGIAKKGETVLLSPGCSSFDMFRDYAHRGDEFKRIVEQIK